MLNSIIKPPNKYVRKREEAEAIIRLLVERGADTELVTLEEVEADNGVGLPAAPPGSTPRGPTRDNHDTRAMRGRVARGAAALGRRRLRPGRQRARTRFIRTTSRVSNHRSGLEGESRRRRDTSHSVVAA